MTSLEQEPLSQRRDPSWFAGISRVADRRRREELLAFQAFHDVLTGLPNRALFADRAAQAFARAVRRGTRIALLFLDLDGFKAVNDDLGHATGDELLVAVGRRLQSVVRPMDTVARIGGDEFVVLLEQLDVASDAERLAERVVAAFDSPFEVGEHRLSLSTSVGVAFAEAGSGSPEALLDRADQAMYRAKRRGAGRVEVYDDALSLPTDDTQERVRALRDALRDGLDVQFLPVAQLHGGAVAAMCVVPTWGGLEPSEVRRLATAGRLDHLLFGRLLDEACAAAGGWRDLPDEPLRIIVDVPRSQVLARGLVQLVARCAAAAGVAPALLDLGIPEAAVADGNPVVLERLAALRALGVRTSLIDVGEGPSAFMLLPRLGVRALRLGPRLLAGAAGPDRPTIRALVALAHELGMDVGASGVTSPEERVLLAELGCDVADGAAVLPAAAPDEVAAAYRRRAARRAAVGS